MIDIAFAGVIYQLFAAPKEEPISGLFADYPMFEAVCISLVYAGAGVEALITPLFWKNLHKKIILIS